MQSLQADRGLLDPSEQVVTAARWEDLDPLEFERFRRSIRERRGRSDESLVDLSDLELAKALGVVEANGSVRAVRLAALLLARVGARPRSQRTRMTTKTRMVSMAKVPGTAMP